MYICMHMYNATPIVGADDTIISPSTDYTTFESNHVHCTCTCTLYDCIQYSRPTSLALRYNM